jgi:hypothetical protein
LNEDKGDGGTGITTDNYVGRGFKKLGAAYSGTGAAVSIVLALAVTTLSVIFLFKGDLRVLSILLIIAFWGEAAIQTIIFARMSSIYKSHGDPGRTESTIGGTVKNMGTAEALRKLLSIALWAVLATVGCIYYLGLGLPGVIAAFLLGAFWLMFLLELIGYIRTAHSDITPAAAAEEAKVEVEVAPDEAVNGYITGIRRVGKGSGSYAVFGTGEVSAPENAIVLTNRNIWLVTVPLEGAGHIVAGTDISQYQWMHSGEVIENKLLEMMGAMALGDLIRSCGRHMVLPLGGIADIVLKDSSQMVTFITRDNKKYSYCMRYPKDYQKAKALFGRG